MTPFQALYGQPPTSIQYYNPGTSAHESIDATLNKHQRVLAILKEILKATQQCMADQANKHRLDNEFNVGDLVFLRLKDYRQSSVQRRESKKLSPRFFGPYPIIERIGKVAYRLQLPKDSKIHLVFHVSLLRPCIGETEPSADTLPDFNNRPTQGYEPEIILCYEGDQVLVKWKKKDITEATWESIDDIQKQYPAFLVDATSIPALRTRLFLITGVLLRVQLRSWIRPSRAKRVPNYLKDYIQPKKSN